MKRENLILDTLCFRLFILDLRKWTLTGSTGPRPAFERDLPLVSLMEAPTKLEQLRLRLHNAEIEVENLQAKFNSNMVPIDSEQSFFTEAALLGVVDLHGYSSPLETLIDMESPQLVPEERLSQIVNCFRPTKVFVREFFASEPNPSGWYATVKRVEYYTDVHLPEEERFIPTGYAIVGH